MVSERKYIIASGPVIIENGKLHVVKDEKDDFYKIPGGVVDENGSLEQGCIQEVKEEINAYIEIMSGKNTTEIKRLDIWEIKKEKHNVSPNIKFLIKKGDIK